MAGMDMLPVIPRVQFLLLIPWRIVKRALVRLDTRRTRLGDMSDGVVWLIQRSSQNKELVPPPPL
jgi:hypothetical protein